MARVKEKTIHSVRHVCMTTTTVLLMSQTQHFIPTVSPPADLYPLPKKTPRHFVTQSIKITSHLVHSQSEKQKNSVYFVARYIALLWLFFHLNCSVSRFVHL